MNFARKLGELSGRRSTRNLWYGFIIFFFALFVIIPTIYVLSYVSTNWTDIKENVLNESKIVSYSVTNETVLEAKGGETYALLNHEKIVENSYILYKNSQFMPLDTYTINLTTGNITFSSPLNNGDIIKAIYSYYGTYYGTALILHSLRISFEIAIIVTIIDFVAGFPLAWILARKKFKGKNFLDTLVDMPLAMPTSALGFSIAIFWAAGAFTSPPGSLSIISTPGLLIILLHVTFSYPYMVRALTAAIEEVDINYEIAASALGASPLTVARTITMPLFKAGLMTGIILCLARSLSETGATFITLTMLMGSANLELGNLNPDSTVTGPALIKSIKDARLSFGNSALAFISIILILSALLMLVIIKVVSTKTKIPMRKVFPRPEKFLSRKGSVWLRDIATFAFFIIIVMIPSFFMFSYVFTAEPVSPDWTKFSRSIYLSFVVAIAVTGIDLLLGVPMAILIARGKSRKSSETLDLLVNVPLIIPTVALGFSLGLFWTSQRFFDLPITILIIFAHVAFTYPFIVRNVAAAIEEIDPIYEDTARTLGANPLQVFRRVLFPIIKPSILAGAIMTFTRSLDETGATIAVIPSGSKIVTTPVYIVELVKNGDYYPAALACIILVIVSFIAMLLLRYMTKKAR